MLSSFSKKKTTIECQKNYEAGTNSVPSAAHQSCMRLTKKDASFVNEIL